MVFPRRPLWIVLWIDWLIDQFLVQNYKQNVRNIEVLCFQSFIHISYFGITLTMLTHGKLCYKICCQEMRTISTKGVIVKWDGAAYIGMRERVWPCAVNSCASPRRSYSCSSIDVCMMRQDNDHHERVLGTDSIACLQQSALERVHFLCPWFEVVLPQVFAGINDWRVMLISTQFSLIQLITYSIVTGKIAIFDRLIGGRQRTQSDGLLQGDVDKQPESKEHHKYPQRSSSTQI